MIAQNSAVYIQVHRGRPYSILVISSLSLVVEDRLKLINQLLVFALDHLAVWSGRLKVTMRRFSHFYHAILESNKPAKLNL